MKSLRARLWLTTTAVLILGLCGAGWLVWVICSTSAMRDLDGLLRARAALAARLMHPPEPQLEPWVVQFLDANESGMLIQLCDGQGRFLARSPTGPTPLVPLTDAARQAYASRAVTHTETVRGTDGREYRVATTVRREQWMTPPQFYVQVAIPEDAAYAPIRRSLILLASGGVLLVALGSLGAWVLVGRWLRSLWALEEAAREMGTHDLARRRLFAPKDDPELAALADTFNTLLDRLDTLHTTQRRLLADASHELRTPLTILLGEIDVALRHERAAGDYRAVLESNREEIARLSRMADNLLALARADAGEILGERTHVDLHTLCGEVCDRLGPRAEHAGVQLDLSAPLDPPLRAACDAAAIERVVFNLIENAITHTPRGENVSIEVTTNDDEACIAVRDRGRGIASEHLPHLFDRFYRVDKSRAREAGGAGLGLAIVKSLIEAHGGRVSVESQLGRGSTFTVRLPALPS